ncbi:hypothetical protein AgCh_000408 [Apium graveolens]
MSKSATSMDVNKSKGSSFGLSYLMLTKRNYTAWSMKMKGIPEDLLLSIVDKKNAKDAWEAIKTMSQGADRVKTARVQILKAKFEASKMKDTDLIDEL